jgi:hypothetical protein
MFIGEHILKITNIPSLFNDKWCSGLVYITKDKSIEIVWSEGYREYDPDCKFVYNINNVIFKNEPVVIAKLKKELTVKGILD